jgi:hypothetical protein
MRWCFWWNRDSPNKRTWLHGAHEKGFQLPRVEAQEEAVASLRAIEGEWVGGGDYHATPEELDAIDEADRSEVASEEEEEVAFRSFRTA